MTRIEKIEMAIEKGITCDPITGKVYGIRGKEITKKLNGYIDIVMRSGTKIYRLSAHQLIYYVVHKKIVD